MPLRQHPLLRFYARAASHISVTSLVGPTFPPLEEVKEYFEMAVAALPPLEPGEDRRHDEIRELLVSVTQGGRPDAGPFRGQVRLAAGRLHDYVAMLGTMGAVVPAQIVPGSLLHFFSDGAADDQTYGRGHRRILEVTDFGIAFIVTDGDKAGVAGRYSGSGDPEELAQFLQPSPECGPDCHRGQ